MAAVTNSDQWLLLPAVRGCAVGHTPCPPSVSDTTKFHRWLRKLSKKRGVLVAEVRRGIHEPSFVQDVVIPRVESHNLRSPAIVLPRAPAATWALWRVANHQRC